MHIEFPVFNETVPDVSSLRGSEMAVLGDRFVSGIRVYVGDGLAATVLAVDNSTHMRVQTPPSNTTGYRSCAVAAAVRERLTS
jgi:hypothetical protein